MAYSLSCSPIKTLSPRLSHPTATRVKQSTYSQVRLGRVGFNGINKGFAKAGLSMKSSNMTLQPGIKSRCLSKSWSMSGGGAGQQCETVTLETPNVVVSPFMGIQKDPMLDFGGGSGLGGGGQEPPPYYRGGGDGGGYSMGGRFSWGAFWLFLAFNVVRYSVMIKKEEDEAQGRFINATGRRKTIRHYLDFGRHGITRWISEEEESNELEM